MSLLVLTSADVDHVLTSFPPTELQDLMARVFHLISSPPPTIHTPHRTTIPMLNHAALFMPARVAHPLLTGTTLKAVSVPQKLGDTRGLPSSTIVLDEHTGAVKALVNARSLTAFRNAAGSLLSTRIAGLTTPTSVVAFGAGKQISAHLALHLRSFPTLTRCTIVNRTPNERLTVLAQRLRQQFPAVTINVATTSVDAHTEQLQESVSNASLIICATSSTAPLFPSSWVSSGTHVILVGSYTPSMREVERALVLRAVGPPSQSRLLVDSRDACAIEAGELIEAGLGPDDVREIGDRVKFGQEGEVLLDTLPLTLAEGESPITMFKSVGVGLQDVAIACAVVKRAEEMGVGRSIGDYDV